MRVCRVAASGGWTGLTVVGSTARVWQNGRLYPSRHGLGLAPEPPGWNAYTEFRYPA